MTAPPEQLPAKAFVRLAAQVQRKGLLEENLQTPPAPSPCISVCRMGHPFEDEETPLCLGCFRTIEEIVAWRTATDAQKRTIWRNILQRTARQPST